MFAHTKFFAAAIALSLATTGPAVAETGTKGVDFTVDVSGVIASEGKLYVSVQEKADFMAERGAAGGIYEIEVGGDQTFTYNVPEGEYAVSVWHDTDNDGEFSMSETYQPLDGWAMSTSAPLKKQPTFQDAKVTVGSEGAQVSVAMIYPKG